MPWSTTQGTAPAAIPDGHRLYAVGDIHGRADLLEAMADLIARDLADHPDPSPTTIFLGDYVDRGPASAAVVERLVRRDFPTPIVTLCGNHEDILVGLLRGEVDLAYYARLGGADTLASYGLCIDDLVPLDAAARVAALADAIPPAHRAFLDGLGLCETVGDYFFCHAGVRPEVPLDAQHPHDLMWIREDFLLSEASFGKVVIHGHTPVPRPLVRRNGIDIDIHAVTTGVLTAIVLTGREQRYLQTAGAASG